MKRPSIFAELRDDYAIPEQATSVTMNTYTYLGPEDATEEMKQPGEIERARAEMENGSASEDDREAI